MPEIKHNFTGGKMQKDLDERLVPKGEYRDAMNIRDELEAFIQNKKIPRLFAPAWIRKDMSFFGKNT